MTEIIKTTLPFHKDFNIYQGQNWGCTLIRKDSNRDPVDLTGWTAQMQIRRRKGGDVLYDLTSDPAAGITITAATGTVAIALTAAQTAAIKVGNLVYDFFMVNAGATETVCILEGELTVHQAVTEVA